MPSGESPPPSPACADHPTLAPDDWFSESSRTTRLAAVCCLRECPVRAWCLGQVLRMDPQPPGIWAGLTEGERRRLAPRWRRRTDTPSRPMVGRAPMVRT